MKKLITLKFLLVLLLVGGFQQHAFADMSFLEGDTLNFIKQKQYIRLKQMANNHYEGLAYTKSIALYKRALKVNPSDDTLKLKVASAYFHINNLDSAHVWYREVIEDADLVSDKIHYINYAETLAGLGKYEEARYWYVAYQQSNPTDQRTARRLKGFENVMSFYKDSVRYTLSPVDFNTDTYDFSPCYYGDQILFVSAREMQGVSQLLRAKYQLDKSYFLNLFVTDTTDEVRIFNKRIKTGYHEGPATFFNNDSSVIFTRNNFTKAELRINKSKVYVKGAEAEESQEGINKLKLFASNLDQEGNWSVPQPLWFNSDEFSTGHPTISKDSKKLYFSSDRPGSLGKSDLYVSNWTGEKWSEPKNLGKNINTEAAELFPFIDEDDVLYFASDGREGLGGLDIFMVDLKESNAEVINMGFPVNTTADDFGLIVKDREGLKEGYFSSNRPGGKGLDDIYQFTYESNRPIIGRVTDLITGMPINEANVALSNKKGELRGTKTSDEKGVFKWSLNYDHENILITSSMGYRNDTLLVDPNTIALDDTLEIKLIKELLVVRGKAIDDIKGTPLDSVRIYVTNHTTGEKFGILTESDGKYSFVAKPDMKYTVLMKKHRFLSSSIDINTEGKRNGEIVFIGRLEEIVIGKPIELNEIHFDLAKWNIRPDAAEELDHFVRQLNENPSIIVELDTHTDSRGGAEYNLNLSDHRAKSAAAYVVKHGIAKERIVGKGYGESKPLNECVDGVKCTEEQHQVNRRAEFRVMGFLPEEESEEVKKWVWIDPDYISASMSEADLQRVVVVDDNSEGVFEITGLVKDIEGKVLENVLLSCIEKATNKTIQVNSNGKGVFKFKVDQNKTYRIVAQMKGFHQEAVEVKIDEVQKTPVEIVLSKM